MRVFFYVQHLLGIGHLRRAATIAAALRQAGFQVTLASGGAPVPGFDVVQLPPVSSPDFRQLVDEHGRAVDERWKERRTAALLDAYRSANADVLIVELFPFGRRQMRFELLPLLEEARSQKKGSGPFLRRKGPDPFFRPLVLCSVRDILQPNAAREAEALERFERYFDRLVVHGDPRVAPFERSFGAAERLAGKLAYTGYVVDDIPEGDAGRGEVLVSCGGGAVGRRLLETAIAARPLTTLRDRPWRLLAGVNAAGFEGEGEGVIVERFRHDFTTRLKNCVLSVSQAGYNTVVETLQARARAVLVPFAAGGESEQSMRARLLAERGLVQVVEEDALGAPTLAAAIDRAAAAARPAPESIDLGGARRTAELLREWLA